MKNLKRAAAILGVVVLLVVCCLPMIFAFGSGENSQGNFKAAVGMVILVPVLAYVCPMLTGVLMVVLVRTFGYGTAWITYVSTGLLSFFLVPDKECMLMYVLFFGYYTIVRQWIGRLRPRSVALAAECLLFNAALAAVNLLLVYVFAIPMDAVSSNKWFLVGFWLAMNLLFFLYERLLGVAELLYARKIEKRLRSVFKK